MSPLILARTSDTGAHSIFLYVSSLVRERTALPYNFACSTNAEALLTDFFTVEMPPRSNFTIIGQAVAGSYRGSIARHCLV